MADGQGSKAFFVEFAEQNKRTLHETMKAIVALDYTSASASDAFIFRDQQKEATSSICRLLELVERVHPDIDRGDIYLYINELSEALFSIALRLGAADTTQRLKRSEGGRKSSEKRREKRDTW